MKWKRSKKPPSEQKPRDDQPTSGSRATCDVTKNDVIDASLDTSEDIDDVMDENIDVTELDYSDDEREEEDEEREERFQQGAGLVEGRGLEGGSGQGAGLGCAPVHLGMPHSGDQDMLMNLHNIHKQSDVLNMVEPMH